MKNTLLREDDLSAMFDFLIKCFTFIVQTHESQSQMCSNNCELLPIPKLLVIKINAGM
jgi:hypothetical protein